MNKLRTKTEKHSIWYDILMIDLIGILLLAVFNYAVYYNLGRQSYEESFASYNERVITLAFENIDQQMMEELFYIPQIYFTDVPQNSSVLYPQTHLITGKANKIKELTNMMTKIKTSYPSVYSIDIFYEGTNTIITGFDRIHFVKKSEDIKNYLPWYQAFVETNKNAYLFPVSGNNYPTRYPVLTYVRRISKTAWNGKSIWLAIHIKPQFSRFIDEKKGEFWLGSAEGTLLYGAEQDNSVKTWILEDMKQERTTKNQIVNLDHQDFMVVQKKSVSTGLKYYYSLNYQQFYIDYSSKNKRLTLIFVSSVLFNILVLSGLTYFNHLIFQKRIMAFSREVGLPIEKRQKNFDDSLIILKEEIQNLSTHIQSDFPLKRQHWLRSLILKRNHEMAGMNFLAEDIAASCVCCGLIELTEQDRSLSAEALQQDFESRNPERKNQVLFTIIGRNSLVIVMLFNGQKKEQQQLLNLIAEMTGHKKMAIGKIYPLQAEFFADSYATACQVASYQFIFSQTEQLFYEDIDISKRKSDGSHLKLFGKIEKALKSEQPEEFQYLIESLRVSFEHGGYSIEYCQSTLRDLVTLLYQLMIQNQLDTWLMFGYDIRDYFKDIKDLKSYQLWINYVGDVYIQYMNEKKQNRNIHFQEQMEKLILDNLENEISLDFLADYLEMRPDALSRMFKQLMGKNYMDYIKEKKLTRSLELLHQDLTVQEISVRLGYHSPQYFIRIFKEQYGDTPYQYKKHTIDKQKKRKSAAI